MQVDDGPLIVREKTHRAPAMTLDQALYEMELVGHDFFLFHDAESGTPSVVYRRKGYDYGVLHLEVDAMRGRSVGGAIGDPRSRSGSSWASALAQVGSSPGSNGWWTSPNG